MPISVDPLDPTSDGRRRARALGAALLALVAAGCGRASSVVTIREIAGDPADRSAVVSRMVARQQPPPSPIRDARGFEVQIGDDVMAPADYRDFYLIEVDPKDVAAWQAILTPLPTMPGFEETPRPCDWWIGRARFPLLTFYEVRPLTGRANGWVGVDAKAGRIYVFSFQV